MNSKPAFEDEEWNRTHSKQPRTFSIANNRGIHASHDKHSTFVYEDYTIAWICALPFELARSRVMLDEEHRQLPSQASDDNTYVLGRIGQHNVVMACLHGEYGTINAAIVATNLKRTFPEIRATLMVGVGGGSPSQADLYLGDVVVGTRVMQYDMGKAIVGGCFQETGIPKTPARLLNSTVSTLRSRHLQHDSSSRITGLIRSRLPNLSRPNCPDLLFQASYEHPPNRSTCDGCDREKLQLRKARFSDEPKVHYGVIASGNTVMKDAKTRDDIAQPLLALCFEMEAAGMMDNLECLPIRGICDYSDSHKNKQWQDYAAATAAAYARELVEAFPQLLGESGQTTTYFSGASERDVAEARASERRQRLLGSLRFPQIDARKTTIGFAHSKTCRWLLQHSAYRHWLNPEMQSQNHGFFWMRGKAGAGKSTMMKFLFLETKRKCGNKPNMATASFFFNERGIYLEKSIAGMYRSLLWQLLKTFPNLQAVLDNTDIVPESQQDCPDLNVLKALLQSAVMALDQRHFICFIDALDECDEQEVRDMVHYFEDLAEKTTEDGIQFRICFSSRPYPYIDTRQGILLTLENEPGHADDLAQYVKSHLRITNSSLLTELQTKVLEKADGIFMWIVLVVEILNKENSHGALALRKRMSEIPTKLSDLFRSMLRRDQERPESLLLCVLWLLCAKRPLSPAEFQHALWAGLLEQDLVDSDLPGDTDIDAVRLITSSSKGLAEISKSKKPTVQFIHQSVPDFLVKEKGLQEMWPELGFDWEGPSHERLRHCCATYLNLPGVQAFVNSRGAIGERNAVAENYSFLEYASQHVLHHANAAALFVSQDDFMSQFFASAWIKVVSFCEGHKAQRYSSHVSPLYVLADRGLGNLVRTRMKRESPIYVPREKYEYPFFAALANGHKGAAAALLGLSSTICDGVDIMKGLKYKKDFKACKGRTPLSWAAQEGRLSFVKVLIRGGANAKETDRRGHTPLLLALQQGHEAVTRFLLDNGADIHTQDKNGDTALIWASKHGLVVVSRLLIEQGANVHSRNNMRETALDLALKQGHNAVVQLLIDNGADINTRDDFGWTAMIWASQQGDEGVVQLLINNGADVHTQDKYGGTALIWASQRGHEAVVQLLINNGADIHTQDNYGRTALIWASKLRHEAVARLLRRAQPLEQRDKAKQI
ncbi:putative ankyrin repeat protein [Colletotrichum chlorophyti]|uniref:Putative ankyrin repeat protein n=1 Tax=Colletotrichum chlorophyti TaxID=708187 RepID=A0A1Q8S879_9PEZI|nr:putative ankyrin repeat protein [Colletotrichum chlorophyti]